MELRKYAGLFISALCVSAAMATTIPNTSPNPKTFLGPTVRLGVTKLITDDSAFSIAGEAGLRNLRLGGTVGWEFDYNQRIKASAEILRQKITYSFFSGREEPWLNQGAYGLDYQYDFRDYEPFNTLLDLNAYYSYAPSVDLGTVKGTYFPTGAQTPQPFVDYRRIAGSHAAGVSPGITIATLDGTRVGAEINYDNVQYDTKNRPALHARGIGGTVKLNQAITDDISVGVLAAVRQPYNNYQADLALDNVNYYGLWMFKLFGAYTIGKESLPTTYNVGIGADYLIDAGTQTLPTPMPDYKGEKKYKDFKGYKGYKDYAPQEMPEPVDKDFLSWVSVPAVYMPQVLAVVDEKVNQICIPPSFTGTIPPGNPPNDTFTGPFTYDLSANFSGTDLTYTIFNDNPPPVQITDGSLKIVNNVLIGSGVYPGGEWSDVFIVATNQCGTASSFASQFTAH